jgi:hypothetical protein
MHTCAAGHCGAGLVIPSGVEESLDISDHFAAGTSRDVSTSLDLTN